MARIPDARLDYFMAENVPYIDLTCEVLGIRNERGAMEYFSREACIVAGIEEVTRKSMPGCKDLLIEAVMVGGAFPHRLGLSETVPVDELAVLVKELRAIDPRVTLIAAGGGINPHNAAAYAAISVDGLATTALYTAKPLDMSARINTLH